MHTASDVITALSKKGSKRKALASQRFFKTGKGEYGEGDIFWGVTVPEQRTIARMFQDLSLSEAKKLLHHRVHECRLTGLIMLSEKYSRADLPTQSAIVRLYLKEAKRVNNWDLVDTSAPRILGAHLATRDRSILYRLASSKDLWERRIAIVATLAFITRNDFKDTIAISKILLSDKHDLIHKAVGWMLREVGKRSRGTLVDFLEQHAHKMPRTALRYSIEHFSPSERKIFLASKG
jgi:3-methyladenine DNA glycosylase AlkD